MRCADGRQCRCARQNVRNALLLLVVASGKLWCCSRLSALLRGRRRYLPALSLLQLTGPKATAVLGQAALVVHNLNLFFAALAVRANACPSIKGPYHHLAPHHSLTLALLDSFTRRRSRLHRCALHLLPALTGTSLTRGARPLAEPLQTLIGRSFLGK
jgi:hypothetical protein